MTDFDQFADGATITFMCPHCHQDTSYYLNDIPSPDWTGDTAASTENYDDDNFCCEHCGRVFSIDIFVNMYEGNVVITDLETNKEIEDVCVKEEYTDDKESEDESDY